MLIFLLFFWHFYVSGAPAPKAFSFHLQSSPQSLDPTLARGTSGSYLFHNLYRSLYRYDNTQGLIPEGAQSCRWRSPLQLSCHLRRDRQWSDGQVITAGQYVKAFKRFFQPQNKSLKTQHLLPLKNARKILSGQLHWQKLGVKARGKWQLEFFFDHPDPAFLYLLSSPAFSPLRKARFPQLQRGHQLITNGPYKVESFHPRTGLQLIPNTHYPGHSQRPPVHIYFTEDHDSALRLFQTHKLNFLRFLTTEKIPYFQKQPGFIRTPLLRFDYIGFHNQLRGHIHLRKALAHSLKYSQLAQLYHSQGQPGCPGLPTTYTSQAHCYNFDLKKAREHLNKVPEALKKRRWKVGYAKSEGKDAKRGMEWLIYQWQKNLGLQFDLQPIEVGMYTRTLSHSPPDIFRKSVTLERPTCYAALSLFTQASTNNFIKYSNAKFEKSLHKLNQQSAPKKLKQHCSQSMDIFLSDYPLIPLGEIYHSQLHHRQFTGWTINEMNQLDLSQLKAVAHE